MLRYSWICLEEWDLRLWCHFSFAWSSIFWWTISNLSAKLKEETSRIIRNIIKRHKSRDGERDERFSHISLIILLISLTKVLNRWLHGMLWGWKFDSAFSFTIEVTTVSFSSDLLLFESSTSSGFEITSDLLEFIESKDPFLIERLSSSSSLPSISSASTSVLLFCEWSE